MLDDGEDVGAQVLLNADAVIDRTLTRPSSIQAGMVWCHNSVWPRSWMLLFAAKLRRMSACVKFGDGVGCEVPGMLGQSVSGFITFSAVMLLKCLMSSAESVALVVEAGSMAAPTGKFTTPYFAASVALSAGAVAGFGSWGADGPPGGGVNGSSPPPPQPESSAKERAAAPIRVCLNIESPFMTSSLASSIPPAGDGFTRTRGAGVKKCVHGFEKAAARIERICRVRSAEGGPSIPRCSGVR